MDTGVLRSVLGIFIWGAIGGIVAIPILVWILVINNVSDVAPTTTRADDAKAA